MGTTNNVSGAYNKYVTIAGEKIAYGNVKQFLDAKGSAIAKKAAERKASKEEIDYMKKTRIVGAVVAIQPNTGIVRILVQAPDKCINVNYKQIAEVKQIQLKPEVRQPLEAAANALIEKYADVMKKKRVAVDAVKKAPETVAEAENVKKKDAPTKKVIQIADRIFNDTDKKLFGLLHTQFDKFNSVEPTVDVKGVSAITPYTATILADNVESKTVKAQLFIYFIAAASGKAVEKLTALTAFGADGSIVTKKVTPATKAKYNEEIKSAVKPEIKNGEFIVFNQYETAHLDKNIASQMQSKSAGKGEMFLIGYLFQLPEVNVTDKEEDWQSAIKEFVGTILKDNKIK